MEKVIRINSLEETIELGNRLGRVLKPNMLITLSGDLGAGDVYKRQVLNYKKGEVIFYTYYFDKISALTSKNLSS